MGNAVYKIEKPVNEPVLSYAPGAVEREELKKRLKEIRNSKIEIPLIIGGKDIKTGNTSECRMPHEHGSVLAIYHKAGKREIENAIDTALKTREEWAGMDWQDRLAIFLKAADLISGPYRALLNGATMQGQSKNVFQAEIDSACELIDFLRFNSYYATRIYAEQPDSGRNVWNWMEYRPLEGFVFAVTPFNFTSIAGNLPTAPAIMGNTVIWKPASSAVYSAYHFMRVLQEAGLPPGVINFLPGDGRETAETALGRAELAGIHFTGSTVVFQSMWETVGKRIRSYRSYPRIVGETGGKDFVFVHESADISSTVTAIVRGAYEYQGQKCSAVSRAYIPSNLWKEMEDELVTTVRELKMGTPEDFRNFINAVIDKKAFDKIAEYLGYAKESSDTEILAGGKYDDSVGYFIEPTIILSKTPDSRTMQEEIFGPVLTVYVYNPDKYEETLRICNNTSPYGLTGSIFARDRKAVNLAKDILVDAAGNFYINDKPTGAVVGQQPFGGSRASGTNDKAGSIFNMMRWVTPRAVKENFAPPANYRYPFMKAE